MVPLSFARINECNTITKIMGNEKIFNHLKSLGIVVGNKISVIAKNDSNLIISVYDSRIGIDKSMALKIMIEEEN